MLKAPFVKDDDILLNLLSAAVSISCLFAGIALAIKTMKPDVTVIGVEPENCMSFSKAMKVGAVNVFNPNKLIEQIKLYINI